MKSDELPKKNYFQHDAELTIDGTPYKKENYLLKSYVIGPLIFMTLLLVGSALLLSSIR
jgi:hypothetical protein